MICFSGEIHWGWLVPDDRDTVSDTTKLFLNLVFSTYCHCTFPTVPVEVSTFGSGSGTSFSCQAQNKNGTR